MEKKEEDYGNERIKSLKNRVNVIENRINNMVNSLHSTTNQSFHILKALNDNIKLLHKMMEEGIGDKENRRTKLIGIDWLRIILGFKIACLF